MFLPVLLVRELGVLGWIVFAVPNVVGAAAMGWVLRSPESSRVIVETHGPACRAFSVVTIAFHAFFVLWFVPRLVGLPMAGGAFAVVLLYLLLTMSRAAADLFASAVAFIVSLAMFAIFTRKAQVTIPSAGSHPAFDAAWLSPVCVFGFLLCPYLDLTFHRARQAQATLAQSRLAFGIGFGVCFLAMIVFSLCYANSLAPLLEPDWRAKLRPAFGWIIATHMIVQTAFTVAVHARSLASSRIRPAGIFGLLVLTQLALLAALAGNFPQRLFNLDPGEVIYRVFMSFYGLIFPAYVWVCMVPGRGGVTPASIRALILAILVAAPMYWLGFIQDRMIWLVPGVMVVVLARFLVPARRLSVGSVSPGVL